MAEFTFSFPDDLLQQLSRLENTDAVSEKMLTECAPVLEKTMRKHLASHKRTGELLESIKARRPSQNKEGDWSVFVGPSGYSTTNMYYAENGRGEKTNRKYKMSNALKAVWLEYGSSEITPTPFLASATKDANNEAVKIMQEVYEREVVK